MINAEFNASLQGRLCFGKFSPEIHYKCVDITIVATDVKVIFLKEITLYRLKGFEWAIPVT